MLVWPYLDYTSGSIGPLAWWDGGSYVFSTFGRRARYYSVQDYPAVLQLESTGGPASVVWIQIGNLLLKSFGGLEM
jgi:hypothetical protein